MLSLFNCKALPAASMWLCRTTYKMILSTRMESRQGFCSAYERERAAQIARIGGDRKVGECIRHGALGDHCNLRNAFSLAAWCRHAGHSRVEYIQKHYLFLHAWKRGEAIQIT